MATDPFEPLLKRLRLSSDISTEVEQAIRRLPITTRRMEGGRTIVATGDRPSVCCLIIDGFVQRSKIVGEGRRQILSFHQPGDVPDLQSLYLHVLDHEVMTLSQCALGFIPHDPLRALIRNNPHVAEALWRDTLIDAALFREWICNVGQRDAASRLAHLIVEVYARLAAIERVNNMSFKFPATQIVLAEAIGTSTVHLNRVLQELRTKGLLEVERGEITIFDLEGLRQVADFDPLYLHLDPAL
ncbi:MAG: Crp/Fnr family transcriptional regulator [Bradyrhizobium sp.]